MAMLMMGTLLALKSTTLRGEANCERENVQSVLVGASSYQQLPHSHRRYSIPNWPKESGTSDVDFG
jgi:hypothetical protein